MAGGKAGSVRTLLYALGANLAIAAALIVVAVGIAVQIKGLLIGQSIDRMPRRG